MFSIQKNQLYIQKISEGTRYQQAILSLERHLVRVIWKIIQEECSGSGIIIEGKVPTLVSVVAKITVGSTSYFDTGVAFFCMTLLIHKKRIDTRFTAQIVVGPVDSGVVSAFDDPGGFIDMFIGNQKCGSIGAPSPPKSR